MEYGNKITKHLEKNVADFVNNVCAEVCIETEQRCSVEQGLALL